MVSIKYLLPAILAYTEVMECLIKFHSLKDIKFLHLSA